MTEGPKNRTLTEIMLESNPINNVVTISTRKKTTRLLEIDFRQIKRDGYQVVRGFGSDAVHLESELNRISAGKLFFSDRIGSFMHTFRVLPHSENLSEQASCGGYHTDFMFQARPPEFVALLCLRPDPKHPVYGRNQVVHRDIFVKKIGNMFGIKEMDLLKLNVEYTFQGRLPIKIPILQRLDDELILKLHTSLMPAGRIESFGDVPLKSVIEAVCGDVAQDVVLDKGDLLIISNHFALHRRSECTLAFDIANHSFRSREMATIRFDQ